MQLLTPALGLIIWTLLAFLVVFLILKKYAWPAILGDQHRTALGQLLDIVAKPRFDLAQILDFHSVIFLPPITSWFPRLRPIASTRT